MAPNKARPLFVLMLCLIPFASAEAEVQAIIINGSLNLIGRLGSKNYYKSVENTNWQEGARSCRRLLGGDAKLAVIEDSAELTAVETFIEYNDDAVRNLWIGGKFLRASCPNPSTSPAECWLWDYVQGLPKHPSEELDQSYVPSKMISLKIWDSGVSSKPQTDASRLQLIYYGGVGYSKFDFDTNSANARFLCQQTITS